MSVQVTVHHVPGMKEYVQIQMAALFAHVKKGGCWVKIITAALVSFTLYLILAEIIYKQHIYQCISQPNI